MEIRREMKQGKTENIDVNEFQSQENPLPCPPEAFSKPTLLPDVLSIGFGLFLLLLKCLRKDVEQGMGSPQRGSATFGLF